MHSTKTVQASKNAAGEYFMEVYVDIDWCFNDIYLVLKSNIQVTQFILIKLKLVSQALKLKQMC